MYPVSKLHDAVLQHANHTNSEYLNELSVAQRDFYLNRGKDIVFEWLTSQDETNDTVRRYLAELTIRDKELETTVSGDKVGAKFPVDFFKHKALYALASRPGCPQVRRLLVRRPTSEKLQRALRNPNSKKIWDFEETFAIEGSEGLTVYTEPGVTLQVFLDYIRRLKDVAYPGGVREGRQYIGADGKAVTQNQDLEIDSAFFHNKMVAMAVLLIHRDYTNVQDFQTQRDLILSFDRI